MLHYLIFNIQHIYQLLYQRLIYCSLQIINNLTIINAKTFLLMYYLSRFELDLRLCLIKQLYVIINSIE